MSDTSFEAIRRVFDLGSVRPVDGWLRFAPPIQERYEQDWATRRVAELRSAILVGLLFYNAYNLTSFVLLRDQLFLSIVLRAVIVTPSSIGLMWLIGRTTPVWTERAVLLGVLNAYLIPVFLFWRTQEPFGLFTFGELPLTIIFATMLLALHFTHAFIFALVAMCSTLLAVVAKDGLEADLCFAFAVQIVTACAFGLYANYRQERRRCLDYLVALEATLKASSAETDRQVFQDLSRTDALTRLPNRRHLAEQLEAWVLDPRGMFLMMIDIDHFKTYNDALGHPAGDDCLQSVAAAFAALTAEDERCFCARFGGEEFTFVVRDASEIEAARWAKSLLQAVIGLGIPHPARPDGGGIVSISIGVARQPGGMAQPPGQLLAAADRALYNAKRRGRNCFVMDEGPSLQAFGS